MSVRLHTPLCDLLGIRIPLLNAPMTPQAGGALARAVGEAGAFGMIGFDADESEEAIAAQLEIVHAGGAPFGIGLVSWMLERRPALVELAIAARPRMVGISFGDPSPYVRRFHDAGILVSSQVQNRAWAQTAIDADVDVVVAQGTEAGGHTGSVGTLPLLQIVLEMTQKPVLAAGGIATGRGMAAALAAGAAGVWVGTPFLVANEARTPAQARERLLASDETHTIYTSLFDRVQGKPWPEEFRGRALRNAFTDRWQGHEDELTEDARQEFRGARASNDYTRAHIYAGQSVGLIDRSTSAAAIVERLHGDAVRHVQRVSTLLVSEN